jgi:Ion channel
MRWIGAVFAAALIVVMFIDAFEAVVLPRRVKHGYRLSRLFYQSTWRLWRVTSRLLPLGRWRSGFLSVFGPLSLFGLLSVWAVGLILGFALLHWSFGTALSFPRDADDSFGTYFYFSGTTFFTLGYGDVVPTRAWGRALSVAEAGIGFGFLAMVISYLPVLYQTFSRREITISLLDARAGSPPTAGELLRRLADARNISAVGPLLAEWERWSAELLESHLSFPVVSYYRSQHDNQSWVAALTMILDTSALLIAGVDGQCGYQARLTFAMARHAAVDLGLVFHTPPAPAGADRLSPASLATLQELLRGAGLSLRDGPAVERALAELRGLYEPFVSALAEYFEFKLSPFQPDKPPIDNWQTSPWMACAPGLNSLPNADAGQPLRHDDVH